MKRRSLLIVFVAGTLLFSAWSNVVAAAFCPRFALNHDCCPKHAAHQANRVKQLSSCHHEMAGMEMDDMQMEPEADSARDLNAHDLTVQLMSKSSSDISGVDVPSEPCAHCTSHSQTTSEPVSVVAIDPSKRFVQTNSPPASFSKDLTRVFADLIVPSEHSPPSPSAPRHVIINVFRI